ncbi:hypothetical protein OIV83_003892 [Microbotryomycetes sp. JL201]|nr:hypothetical protein OIV83_003892 [Microbotryomycetes sp. JL201]
MAKRKKGPKTADQAARTRARALERPSSAPYTNRGAVRPQQARARPPPFPAQQHAHYDVWTSRHDQLGVLTDWTTWQGPRPPFSWQMYYNSAGAAAHPRQHEEPAANPMHHQQYHSAHGPPNPLHPPYRMDWDGGAYSSSYAQQSHMTLQDSVFPANRVDRNDMAWGNREAVGASGWSVPFEPSRARLQEQTRDSRSRSPSTTRSRLRRSVSFERPDSGNSQKDSDELNGHDHVLTKRQERNTRRAQARQERQKARREDDRVFRDQRERGYESPPPPWITGDERGRELQRQLQKRAQWGPGHDRRKGDTTRTREGSPGQPVPFERRKKWARASGSPPPPTEEYLAMASKPSMTLPDDNADALPPQLILDLNNTLLCRMKTGKNHSNRPWVRPYASTFLQYACGAGLDGRRLWETIVFSSAASYNVLALLEALGAVPFERARHHQMTSRGLPWQALPGEALSLVWTRENLGLTAQEFTINVETCKDLGQIWDARPGWGPERTVLLDDEPAKAAQQPFNHVPIHPFIIDPDSVKNYESCPDLVNNPYPVAKELPEGHSYYHDTSLLSAIYVLEQVRKQTNIAGFIKNTGLKLPVDDEAERVKEGRRICANLGIEVTGAWDSQWWDKTRKAAAS